VETEIEGERGRDRDGVTNQGRGGENKPSAQRK
jgi:hypothetical protein